MTSKKQSEHSNHSSKVTTPGCRISLTFLSNAISMGTDFSLIACHLFTFDFIILFIATAALSIRLRPLKTVPLSESDKTDRRLYKSRSVTPFT